MDYEFNQDGYATVKYEISYINATFGEDQNMNGVCRMTGVEIEYDGDVPSETISKYQNQILNYFAAKEYFTDDPDWRDDAANDISEYTGVSNVNVD